MDTNSLEVLNLLNFGELQSAEVTELSSETIFVKNPTSPFFKKKTPKKVLAARIFQGIFLSKTGQINHILA